MAVNVNNGRIGWTYPFNVGEALAKIHGLLGEPLRYIGGKACYDTRAVCTSARINPYSLIRPTYSTKALLGEGQLKQHVPKPGFNAGYGWKEAWVTGNFDDLLIEFDGKRWEHANPEMNGSDYAILNHFNGYNHNAEFLNPLYYYTYDGKYQGDIKIGAPFVNLYFRQRADNNGGLAANEFFEGMALKIAVVKPNGYIYHATPDSGNGDGLISKVDKTFSFKYSLFDMAGEYTVIPYAFAAGEPGTVGAMHCLNFFTDANMRIDVISNMKLSAKITSIQKRASLWVYVSFKNTDSIPRTITPIEISYTVYYGNYQEQSGTFSLASESPVSCAANNSTVVGYNSGVMPDDHYTNVKKVVLTVKGEDANKTSISATGIWYPS